MDPERIRNFCIIAHIDHGKSTLADRFLELTGTVPKRALRSQFLDQMDLERERGITIKLQPVRMAYRGSVLNLIDTPGHVDFSYEVSRSLAACEGAIVLVDATQGVEAQTIAHVKAAQALGLRLIGVINKIDLHNADVAGTRTALTRLLACDPSSVLAVSAKTGQGVDELLAAVVQRIPAPQGNADRPLRCLVFDSKFDEYKGVIAYVRVVDGTVRPQEQILLCATGARGEALDVGVFLPNRTPSQSLTAGEIGYVATSHKDVRDVRVGDTLTHTGTATVEPLPGYTTLAPVVFAGFYPADGSQYEKLRAAAEQLRLNDAAFTFEPERSPAFGFGLRCGFLGVLHLDITRERLKREFGVEVAVTPPSVRYEMVLESGKRVALDNPVLFPENASDIQEVREPWILCDIILPSSLIGPTMELFARERGVIGTMEYLDDQRVLLPVELPLTRLITGLYDKLKSASRGYASLSYTPIGMRPCVVDKLSILVAGEAVEPLATIVYTDERDRAARRIVESLRENIPPEQFEIRIQAAVGGTIVAAERIPPLRKDVTAKLSGGDVTRKRKLLERQKRGKRRMRHAGKVALPADLYRSLLQR